MLRTCAYAAFTAVLSMTALWACSDDDPDAIPSPSGDGGVDPSTDADGGTTPGTDGGAGGEGVSFTYGSCAAIEPCGGDPVGTWKFTAGCIGNVQNDVCPELAVKSADLRADGTVTVTATTIERRIVATTKASITLPASCTAQAGGSCAFLQIGLMLAPPTGPGFDKATCTTVANGCDCDIETTATETTSGTYTVDGNVLHSEDGTDGGTDYPFCRQGNELKYKDTFQQLVEVNVEMAKQ